MAKSTIVLIGITILSLALWVTISGCKTPSKHSTSQNTLLEVRQSPVVSDKQHVYEVNNLGLSSRKELLEVWQSPVMSGEQRVDEVNKLIPLGASQEFVEEIL